MKILRAIIFSGIFATILLVVTFVLLEIGFTLYLNHFADKKTFLNYASIRQLSQMDRESTIWSPHVYLGHYPTPGYKRGMNKHNAMGFRGDEIVLPKPKNEFRIVCLGGSTTYTVNVDDYHKSYPALLERNLKERGYENVTVINAGAGWWTSWETLINFEFRILSLEPDMIIVYHGINDIYMRFVWPPAAYKGDNSGSRNPSLGSFMPPLHENSAFVRYALIKLGIMNPHSALMQRKDITPVYHAGRPLTYYGNYLIHQMRRNQYPSGFFRKVGVEQMLAINPPVFFKRNIESLVSLAQSKDIDVVLTSFAYIPRHELDPDATKIFVQEFEEINSILKDISEDRVTHFFGFDAVMPKSKEFFNDEFHVNKAGSALKAKLFADYLVANNLLEKK